MELLLELFFPEGDKLISGNCPLISILLFSFYLTLLLLLISFYVYFLLDPI